MKIPLATSHLPLAKIILLILILTVFLAQTAFSQSMVSQQSMLGGGNSVPTAAEIAAAREMMRNQNMNPNMGNQSISRGSVLNQNSLLNQNMLLGLDTAMFSLMPTDSLLRDSLLRDSLLRDSLKIDTLRRYEQIVFSQIMPSAFYEIQGIVPADYPLKPGDNLELSLWGAVERQFALVVNNQGGVFVEGVGLVSVINLTIGEAEKLITKKLQAVYSGIVQGRISVNLRTTRLSPTKVFVMGFVQRPGGYDLPGNANVFLALYRAGGPEDIGSVREIVIRRANGDSAKVDLYDFLLKGKKTGEGLLRDGDLIFVPKTDRLVKATGTIGRPAIYELKEKESLSDLLSFAGGALPNADHTVNLWRIGENGVPEVLEPGKVVDFAKGKKEFQMQNGDSIFVYSSTKPNKNSIEVFGSVFYPGFYNFTENMGVSEAIELAGGVSTEAFMQRVVVERINPDSSFSYFGDDHKNTLGLKLSPNDKVIVLDSRILKNLRTVSVTGFVKNPMDFEWQDSLNALDLIALCGGFTSNAFKNRILIERLVPGEQATEQIRIPLKNELSVENSRGFVLEPGDRIVVEIDDSFYEQELVTLSGAFRNIGTYSLVHRGETFKEFMKRVAKLDDMAYVKGGQLFRRSLEPPKDTSKSKLIEEEKISYRMTFDFERVLQGKDKDIGLQSGDSIYIPFEMITVNVVGEVTSPGHVLWQKGWKAKDYLNAAGGLTIFGDEDRVILTYANGLKTKIEDAKMNPDPGSEIRVSYKQPPEPTKITEIIQVIGTITTSITALTTLLFLLMTN